MAKWTDEELDQLCDLYGTMPAHELAAKLGRSYNSVNSQAQTLGLMESSKIPRISHPAPGVTVHRCLG